MSFKVNFSDIATTAGLSSLATTTVTGISSMIGRNWLSIGACGGFGFGLIQGYTTIIVYPVLKNLSHINERARALIAETIGGIIGCGLSYAAASLGFIAAPVSIPTAAVLTTASFALKFFFGKEVVLYSYIAAKQFAKFTESVIDKFNADTPAKQQEEQFTAQ